MNRLIWICFAAAVWAGSAVAAEVPADVVPRATAAGIYLTDPAGLTLYTYERDPPGVSACDDECAQSWPPVMAADARFSHPDWVVLARSDGVRQWVWRGRPLYRHVRDGHPGAALGDGAAGAWHVAFAPITLPAGLALRRTLAGRVIADSRGFTLYWRDGAPAATDDPLADYRPVSAPAIAKARAPWSVVSRADGSVQWAYDGRPLYAFARDRKPGDALGHVPAALWLAAALEPPPAMPAWVTVQTIDTGRALANAQGLTLYAARSMDQIVREKTCMEDCMRLFMPPVLAGENEGPVGNWSIATNAAGQRQWHFNGAPVFTHSRDKKPGDSTGAGFGVGQGIGGGFRPIMQSALLPAP